MKENDEELDFEVSKEEEAAFNDLAKEFMTGFQNKTMGDDYAEVWEAINSLCGYPENIEIGEIDLSQYEDGIVQGYVHVWGDDIYMGTEFMEIKDGKIIDDAFFLKSGDTYMHNALESGKFYLDDKEIQLGKTTLKELESLWWIGKVDEEKYLIWKDDAEKDSIGVYVKEGIIMGVFLDSTQVYRFRFDSS